MIPQFRIRTVLLEQFCMRAIFDDLTLLKHDDAIELGDGGETVGNDDARAAFHKCFE